MSSGTISTGKWLGVIQGKLGRNGFYIFLTVLFYALFAFPLFPLHVTNVILLSLAVGTVVGFIINPFSLKKTLLVNLVFVIPFIPYLLEFLFSGFDRTAHFEFEKKLFFFTAPFIIPVFIKLTGFNKTRIPLLFFSLSLALLTLYADAGLLLSGLPFRAAAYDNSAYLLREAFEKLSGLHPTYYSAMALAAAAFLFDDSNRIGGRLRFLLPAAAVLLIVTVLFIAVRVAVITAVVFLVIWLVRSGVSNLRKLIIGLGALLVIVALMLSLPSLKNRFSEMISWKSGQTVMGNTVAQRAMIVDCSLRVFGSNLLVGTGSRHAQDKLNACYAAYDCPGCEKQSFNPHNQYLQMGINYGILFLLIFLAALFMIFRKSVKTNAGLYFTTAILIFFLSESMLERQMGVYFFGLFALLFYNIDPGGDEQDGSEVMM